MQRAWGRGESGTFEEWPLSWSRLDEERVVGGSEGVMVQGMPGCREEFGIYWKPLRTGVHVMISDPPPAAVWQQRCQ